MTNTRILLPFALAATYLATLGLATLTASTDRLILAGILTAPLIWLSLTDLARHEIPDLATATIAVAGVVFQWHLHGLTAPFFWTILAAAALTAAFWGAGSLYFHRNKTEALGIGDAKLIGAGTLCLGPGGIWAMLFLAASGGILAILLARRREKAGSGIAFGPFLAYALFILINFPLS
ncbi:prepilin peptidase [Fuscovulum ytuae]|uniref:Prepilin peptidase n=1 Tax=Fuscovulum ytuae TaxID=3042299 RepID=A0ABY8QBV4_9RHOB|nr:prepilin peptidase [Fuscovulum sp. YMD61]WGV18346.1 prepilin peptidase [Fuscovulum sp. YMD61]